jgi:hypothetical protein
MGKLKIPEPVKLIAGVIYSPGSTDALQKAEGPSTHSTALRVVSKSRTTMLRTSLINEKAEGELVELYGQIDYRSKTISFDTTDYYSDEMGKDLMRYWISFENPVSLRQIWQIKINTNKIEQKYAAAKKRKINIDPGYIAGARLVLFSSKDYSHRIYLDKGIYAEVTLIYKKGRFHELEWTYPDYRTDTAKEFFAGVRKKYIDQINHPLRAGHPE